MCSQHLISVFIHTVQPSVTESPSLVQLQFDQVAYASSRRQWDHLVWCPTTNSVDNELVLVNVNRCARLVVWVSLDHPRHYDVVDAATVDVITAVVVVTTKNRNDALVPMQYFHNFMCVPNECVRVRRRGNQLYVTCKQMQKSLHAKSGKQHVRKNPCQIAECARVCVCSFVISEKNVQKKSCCKFVLISNEAETD